jgi:predicted AAA+ superfamily ATPase
MKRAYERLLLERLRQFPCVAVLGPRQCGKTTLIEGLRKPWRRFDLERSADFEVVSRDPDLFFRLNPRRVALDEAQVHPPLFSALRVAIDERRRERGRFVITGSSSPSLVRHISETLAGRVAIIEMAPLSCLEAYVGRRPSLASLFKFGKITAKDFESLKPRLTLSQIHAYWLKGGYPEPWVRRGAAFRTAWMESYFQTYIQRDVARLFPGLNQAKFRLFSQHLAGFSGSIVNCADLGRALGISSVTAQEYLGIAEGSYLWRNLPAYGKGALRRLVKHPKGFLRDTGILHHFLRVNDLESLMAHPRMGASWEGLVTEELLRGLALEGVPHEAYYYRTYAGGEVDLVLEGNFGTVPVEIKHAQTLTHYDLRSLTDFVQEHKCEWGLVVHNGAEVRRLTERIVSIPFACL